MKWLIFIIIKLLSVHSLSCRRWRILKSTIILRHKSLTRNTLMEKFPNVMFATLVFHSIYHRKPRRVHISTTNAHSLVTLLFVAVFSRVLFMLTKCSALSSFAATTYTMWLNISVSKRDTKTLPLISHHVSVLRNMISSQLVSVVHSPRPSGST